MSPPKHSDASLTQGRRSLVRALRYRNRAQLRVSHAVTISEQVPLNSVAEVPVRHRRVW